MHRGAFFHWAVGVREMVCSWVVRPSILLLLFSSASALLCHCTWSSKFSPCLHNVCNASAAISPGHREVPTCAAVNHSKLGIVYNCATAGTAMGDGVSCRYEAKADFGATLCWCQGEDLCNKNVFGEALLNSFDTRHREPLHPSTLTSPFSELVTTTSTNSTTTPTTTILTSSAMPLFSVEKKGRGRAELETPQAQILSAKQGPSAEISHKDGALAQSSSTTATTPVTRSRDEIWRAEAEARTAPPHGIHRSADNGGHCLNLSIHHSVWLLPLLTLLLGIITSLGEL